MRELPILYNTEMVKAILEDRKTQTRRPIKGNILVKCKANDTNWFKCLTDEGEEVKPQYQVGDHLYVRETWCEYWGGIIYKADEKYNKIIDNDNYFWKPSIHMPKKYARIWLEVTDVRVERIQNISVSDCIAEGIPEHISGMNIVYAMRDLWISCGYNWEDWVWVYEFKVVSK